MCDAETPDLALHLECLIAGVNAQERREYVQAMPSELAGIRQWKRLVSQIRLLRARTPKALENKKSVALVIAGLVVKRKRVKAPEQAALACMGRSNFFNYRAILERELPQLFRVSTLDEGDADDEESEGTAQLSDDDQDGESDSEEREGTAQPSDDDRSSQSEEAESDSEDSRADLPESEDSEADDDGSPSEDDNGDGSAIEDVAVSASDSADDGGGVLIGDLHLRAAEQKNADKWTSGMKTVRRKHGKDETSDKYLLGQHLLAARILKERVTPANMIRWSEVDDREVYRWMEVYAPGCVRP
jgi:hypothetical protein